MDLDRFKTINDSLGHEAGDRLLVTVAERFKQQLRPEDVLARFGGDEFAVLLETVENLSEVIRVAQRIAEVLREPFTVDDHQVSVSTSVGIALGTAHANDDPEGMLRAADVAMYRAKEQGPGRYAVFDPAMQTRAQERLELEAELGSPRAGSSCSTTNPRSPCTTGAWSASKPCCAGNIPKGDYSNRRPSCPLPRRRISSRLSAGGCWRRLAGRRSGGKEGIFLPLPQR